MRKQMLRITTTLASITLILALLCLFFPTSLLETLLISFGTTLYHFAMRLAVGTSIDRWKHNQWNYQNPWFQEKPHEKLFFDFIKIKKWKHKIPTYTPEQFDLKHCSLETIVMATCQAEVIHEVNMVLSFLPVFLSLEFGSAGVFWITSILAALIDSVFVMLQRYNRPRFRRLMEKQKQPE